MCETAGSALAFVRLEGIIKILIAVPVRSVGAILDSQLMIPSVLWGAGCDSGRYPARWFVSDGICLPLGYSPDIDA